MLEPRIMHKFERVLQTRSSLNLYIITLESLHISNFQMNHKIYRAAYQFIKLYLNIFRGF